MKTTRLYAALAAALLASAALAPAAVRAQDVQASPKHELRGVWVSTHLSLDWPNRTQAPAQQRAALTAILDHNKATGMNAVFFQVRSQSDAMYPSELEPWSYYLTNNQGSAPAPFWDPLAFAIEETHKRGMEFHAWINPYRAVANTATESNAAQYASTHVSRTHPEWMLTVGTVKILNPGLAPVRDHVSRVIQDIVGRYDIDGLHFDDYFYPSGTIADDAAYNADPRGFAATTAGRADWRRDNINMLIERVGAEIRLAKPWVKFGVSPSGIYRSSLDPAVGSPTSAGASQHYVTNFADTRKWLREGWVDYLAPQVYWYIGQAGSDYKLLVPWWNENAFGRHIYIGLADYKMNTAGWTSPAQIADQIGMNRANANVFGQIHFRHAFLQADALGYRTALKQSTYHAPALPPGMAWKGSGTPLPPSALAAAAAPNDAVQLSWTASPDASDELEKVRRYAVYRSDTREFDLEAPGKMIALTDGAAPGFVDANAGAGKYWYYTVTAVNRLSSESTPAALATNDHEPPVVTTRAVSRTLANGQASISAQDVDGGSTDNWGIESLSVSRSSFSCSDIGAARVSLMAVDKGGNAASAEAAVNVEGRVPQPSIQVSRSGIETGLPVEAIALGYGAQTVSLNAVDAGGADGFAWTPAAGLSVNGAGATFAPNGAGSFTLSVLATSENGCAASTTKTVNVIEARCGNKGDKVLVCNATGSASNPGSQVCVSENAVPAMLRKGAKLGACG
ncbi:hypothetical protein SRABI118_03169 [Massilia sp. Bi118]|uniref:family 10 glycosylhydrolase n=1 Tax=Massilia sp. Bi118 TaxID=2822346 RepID=UPI001DC01C15|nr:family 10 glycosylhydrolase [Massilia sp. Bi118]CAH0259153.1 hypothetical protein SRABI118_03169 [Massilia sp. Bi118]